MRENGSGVAGAGGCAVWRVDIDGEWVEQEGVSATAITEADVENDVGRLQTLAADVVRVCGVWEDGGCPCAVVNGDYVLSAKARNRHIQYVKEGDANISMWWLGKERQGRAPRQRALHTCLESRACPP